MKKNFNKTYSDISKSDSFKQNYSNKSIGEVMMIDVADIPTEMLMKEIINVSPDKREEFLKERSIGVKWVNI